MDVTLKIYTSYFYHIRYFKPYMIPISTAVFDPKWYHNFKGKQHCFIDKNGVINGLSIAPLTPGATCNNLCRGVANCASKDPKTCDFLREYKKQLDALDFDLFMLQLQSHVDRVSDMLSLEVDPIIVFMFHETYENRCSERWAIQEWFKDNGIIVEELRYPINMYY